MSDKMTASEALFGFMGWLTSQPKAITLSSHHDAAIAANLVEEFCNENSLEPPRDGWEFNLIHPSGEYSGIANQIPPKETSQ